VWRIVKFKVEHWPKEQYGEFYNGDSYIVLNVDEDGRMDVHFWIGKHST
jgi:gelsolin